MENKSCERTCGNCGRINTSFCYRCLNGFTQHLENWQPAPAPNKMIEVEGFNQVLDYDTENGHESRKNNVKIMIDPTQPAIQSYIAQEIERQGIKCPYKKYIGHCLSNTGGAICPFFQWCENDIIKPTKT